MNKKELTKKELTAAVKRMAYELGADMVGVAPVSRFDGQPHVIKKIVLIEGYYEQI